jgi:hypothetical protein
MDFVVVVSLWSYTTILNKLCVVPQSEKIGRFKGLLGISGHSCIPGVGAAGHLFGGIRAFRVRLSSTSLALICRSHTTRCGSDTLSIRCILRRFGAVRIPYDVHGSQTSQMAAIVHTSAPPAARFEEYSYSAASHQPCARTAGKKERLRICTLYRAVSGHICLGGGCRCRNGFAPDLPRLPATVSLSRS